ncbi:MAG: glycosyltransferase family 4 protein [Dehalococcoidia bacterium]
MVDYAPDVGKAHGWRQRLLGGHVRQAWGLARRVQRADSVLADGEHTGIPLLLFLALRRRKPVRVVIIGHLVSRPWKRVALAFSTRLGIPGVLVLHSVEQQRRVVGSLGPRWTIALVPYQVDTEFWTGNSEARNKARPLVVAAGSEHRDYETLALAAEGLDADVVVAAGSHWARTRASIRSVPPNMRFLDETLDFAALRALYRSAAVVAVPLNDVPNQSGVTTILEAMSCGRPVVLTATVGQRECVTGPIITADGEPGTSVLMDRGPHMLGGASTVPCWTGLYVPPGDASAMRKAIRMLLADRRMASAMGELGSAVAAEAFSIERFVATMAALLESAPLPAEAKERRPAVA